MGNPLNQSSISRAWTDTKWSFRNLKFWFIELMAALAFASIATTLKPETTDRYVSAGYQVFGGFLGAIVGFGIIFLIMLLRAPYKQRNEAKILLLVALKPILLPNRQELLRAISSVQQKTQRLLWAQEKLDGPTSKNFDIPQVDRMKQRDYHHTEFEQAMKKLISEITLTSEPYHELLYGLADYISKQVLVKTTKPTILNSNSEQARILPTNECVDTIVSKANEVIHKLNELSGQVYPQELPG